MILKLMVYKLDHNITNNKKWASSYVYICYEILYLFRFVKLN